MVCRNCERLVAGTREDRLRDGLCSTCFVYRNRTGKPRPRYLFDEPPIACANCDDDLEGKRKIGNLCIACAEYKRRTGRNRPRRLWNKELLCRNKNCRMPLKLARRKRGLYCANCDWYRKKHGVDRPKSLCSVSTLGWCECGQPAKHEKSFSVLTGSKNGEGGKATAETLFLCDECLSLFI